MSLATAVVGLVILADIATGQGPPQLNSYLAASPIHFVQPPRTVLEPVEYMPRGQYDGYKQPESEYDRREEKKDLETEAYKDNSKDVGYGGQGLDYKKFESTTSAPGMFSSFSNAWKSLTGLGRKTRSIHGPFNKLNIQSQEGNWSPYEFDERFIPSIME